MNASYYDLLLSLENKDMHISSDFDFSEIDI